MGDLLEQAKLAMERAKLFSPLDAGIQLGDLISRPGNAVRSGVVQADKDLQGQGIWGAVQAQAAVSNPGNMAAFLAANPKVAQAVWEGFTGERRTDPTELPDVRDLPDNSLFQAGPVNITPKTLAGFVEGTAMDPVTYTPGVLGKGLEAIPALSRFAKPAEVGMQALGHGLGAVQGAELVGRDPETGEVDPGRAALGAVAGLGVQNAGRVIKPLAGLAKKGYESPNFQEFMADTEGGGPPERPFEIAGDIVNKFRGNQGDSEQRAVQQWQNRPGAQPPPVAPQTETGAVPLGPRTSPGKTYTGIGSRDTPPEIQALMTKIASKLNEQGYTLRSGAAEAADSAFEAGAGGNHEIFLPWAKFGDRHLKGGPGAGYSSTISPEAFAVGKTHFEEEYGPGSWDKARQSVQKLMARNTHQVLGQNLDSPSDFVLAWTPGGQGKGGTGQAIRVARARGIKVFDLGDPAVLERMQKFAGETGDVAQEGPPAAAPPDLDAARPSLPVRFNSYNKDTDWLSNFSPHPVDLGAEGVFPTAEHAYQALKTDDLAQREMIRNASYPAVAKRMGRSVTARPDWATERVPTMERILRAKIEQNPELAQKLLDTGDRDLIHDAPWGDTFWGVDKNGQGDNRQGQILMRIRDEMQGNVEPPRVSPRQAVAQLSGDEDPGPDPFAGRSYQDLSRDEINQANQWAKDKVAYDQALLDEGPPGTWETSSLDQINHADAQRRLQEAADNRDPAEGGPEDSSLNYRLGQNIPRFRDKATEQVSAGAPDDGRPAKFTSGMYYGYSGKARPEVTSKTTFEAIQKGERTSTTRWDSSRATQRWADTQPGDVVEVTGDKGQRLRIRITGKNRIDFATASPEEIEAWSKAEGWSTEAAKGYKKNGPAWQIHYEYLGPGKAPDGAPIINQMGQVVGNPDVTKAPKLQKAKTKAELEQEAGQNEVIDKLWGPAQGEEQKADGEWQPTEWREGHQADPIGPSEFPNQAAWQQASSGRSLGPLPHVPDVAPRPGEPPTPLAPGGTRLSIRPGGELTPNIPPSSQLSNLPPGVGIEASKRELSDTAYRAGLAREAVYRELDENGNPTDNVVTSIDRAPVDETDEATGESHNPLSTSDKRSPFAEAYTRLVGRDYPELDEQGNPVAGPPEIKPVGGVKGDEDVTVEGLNEYQKQIGYARSGSSEIAGSSLEGSRYHRANLRRAHNFYEDELRESGGDPLKSRSYRNEIENIAFAPEEKKDPKTKQPIPKEVNGKQQYLQVEGQAGKVNQVPLTEVTQPAWKRIENGTWKKGMGWDSKPPSYIAKFPDDPKYWPKDWQKTDEGAEFVRKQVAGMLKRTLHVKDDAAVADELMRRNAVNMANAANADNPLSVTKRRADTAPKGDAQARDEELDVMAQDDAQRISSDVSDEEIGHMTGEGRMDPHQTEQEREADKRSRDASRGTDPFTDEDSQINQREYRQLERQISEDQKYLGSLSDPKKVHGYGKPIYDKEGNPVLDEEGRPTRTWKEFSEAEVAKQIELAQLRIERATKRMSKMDVPEERSEDAFETPGYKGMFPVDARVENNDALPMQPPIRPAAGVRATVHFEPTSENPQHGPWPTSRVTGGKGQRPALSNNPRTYTGTGTGILPNTRRLQTSAPRRVGKDENIGQVEDKGKELQALRKKYLSLTPDERIKQMTDLERERAAQSLEPPGKAERPNQIARPEIAFNPDAEAGDLTEGQNFSGYRNAQEGYVPGSEGVQRAEGRGGREIRPETVDASTAYFKAKMAELLGLPPVPAPARAVGSGPHLEARYGRADYAPPNEWFRLQGLRSDPNTMSLAGGVSPLELWRWMSRQRAS